MKLDKEQNEVVYKVIISRNELLALRRLVEDFTDAELKRIKVSTNMNRDLHSSIQEIIGECSEEEDSNKEEL